MVRNAEAQSRTRFKCMCRNQLIRLYTETRRRRPALASASSQFDIAAGLPRSRSLIEIDRVDPMRVGIERRLCPLQLADVVIQLDQLTRRAYRKQPVMNIVLQVIAKVSQLIECRLMINGRGSGRSACPI